MTHSWTHYTSSYVLLQLHLDPAGLAGLLLLLAVLQLGEALQVSAVEEVVEEAYHSHKC